MRLERYKVEMVNQLPFYTCPKVLIHNEYFNNLNSDAKILYMVMQNRVLLSKENNWVDENNEVYIYLTIDEACEILTCSIVTARKAISQLKDIGLIEIVRQGLSKPNKIYINTMIEDEKVIFLNDKNKHSGVIENNNQGCKNKHSRVIKNNSQGYKDNHSRVIENNIQECNNLTPRNNNIRNNNIEIISSSSSSNNNNNNITATTINTSKDYIKKYIKVINPLASRIELEMLSTYEDEIEPELIEIAIEEAILNNVFKLNYIKAILNNCIESNIKTAEQYRNMKKLRKRKTKENENGFNRQNQRNTTTSNKPTAEDFRELVGGEYL